MNSSGKKVVLFMLDRVHTIKNGNLLQDYRFIFIGYYYYSAPQFSLATFSFSLLLKIIFIF